MKNILRSWAPGATLVVFALLAIASGGKKTDANGEGGTAASSGGGGAAKASCNQIDLLGTCTEYPSGSGFTLAEAACGMLDAGPTGGWGKPCPTDRVVGKCVDTNKDALYKDETELYYAPEHTVESAKKECDGSLTKGKTFTAGTWKPAEGEARGHCVRKLIGSTHKGPDQCDEWPYGTSTEDWDVLKMNCSSSGNDTLVVGKACPKEMKDGASSKCEEKDGTVVYNQPPDSKNAKDFCESEPSKGKWTKLGGAAAAAPAKPGPAAPKPAGKK
jgi:hypothetical protein